MAELRFTIGRKTFRITWDVAELIVFMLFAVVFSLIGVYEPRFFAFVLSLLRKDS